MKFRRHLQESLRNLRAAKLRSLLAILGILVGTGSVVALISASQAATDHALSEFKALGTNLLALNMQTDPAAEAMRKVRYLKQDDLPILQQLEPEIALSAPYITAYTPIFYDGRKLNGQIIGATDDLREISKLHLASGRFVSELDGHSYYCVIGHKIVETLKAFGEENPIGKQIKLGNVYFTIIGELKPWQTNLFLFSDLNTAIITPLQTSYMLSKYAQIHDVLFRIKPNIPLKQVQASLTDKLADYLPGQRVMFRSPEQIINIMSKQRSTFTWLLAMIGGISLLVGGIGVMNIMLVSVVERRREIGIRMAIGAKQKDIRQMFLIEAVSLTTFGGILGIATGLIIAASLGHFSGWGFHFYLLPPTLGFSVSVIVGIVSGFYPALKASNLNPIEILQSD